MTTPDGIEKIPSILAALEIYMWTLTIDETKVVLSTLQQYFTSPDLNEVLKGDCVEDVMGGLECAEELMKKWEKAELGEYEDQDEYELEEGGAEDETPSAIGNVIDGLGSVQLSGQTEETGNGTSSESSSESSTALISLPKTYIGPLYLHFSEQDHDDEDYDPRHCAQGHVISSLMYTFLMKSAQEISVVITDLMAVLRVRGEEREKVPKWKALHYLGTIIQRDLRKIRGEGDKKGADYEWKGLEVPD